MAETIMYIKIIKCDNENFWYYGKEYIGDVHEVVSKTDDHYEVGNTGNNLMILKEDARVLPHRFAD